MDNLELNQSSPIDSIAMMRLWQMISPSLPIGAYAYSQGLESAVEKGWVDNEAQALLWIEGLLTHSLSQLDAPILVRFYQAWENQDNAALSYWNEYILACRESSELYQEDLQMGLALKRLLHDILKDDSIQHADSQYISSIDATLYGKMIGKKAEIDRPTYILMFALATHIWQIPLLPAIQGFLWSWCENQVAAAIKLIPLGQTAGQRILSRLMTGIAQGANQAIRLKDDEIGALAPGFAIACAHHETQYSRLFRS